MGTTFTGPLEGQGANNPTGNPQTDTAGYVGFTKVIPLGSGTASRAVITLPERSILQSCVAFATSAFAADVSAANVNFGNSSDATRYGVISVSAIGQNRSVTAVSAVNDFLNGTPQTMVITISAVSTTTFTTGGAYALVRFIMVD